LQGTVFEGTPITAGPSRKNSEEWGRLNKGI